MDRLPVLVICILNTSVIAILDDQAGVTFTYTKLLGLLFWGINHNLIYSLFSIDGIVILGIASLIYPSFFR